MGFSLLKYYTINNYLLRYLRIHSVFSCDGVDIILTAFTAKLSFVRLVKNKEAIPVRANIAAATNKAASSSAPKSFAAKYAAMAARSGKKNMAALSKSILESGA
ncbi:hypothetical protein SDC9_172897 [bioreactor metagenome]|uniref:Uncharacterized protein n=1 Tax=bioreactor metagenome TaxID=1076179 RepID=A0A645GEZ3_9ZZZZ